MDCYPKKGDLNQSIYDEVGSLNSAALVFEFLLCHTTRMLSHTENTEKSKLNNLQKLKTKVLNGLETARFCAAVSLDKKAENVVILDVAELTSVADYFVICSAPSERQVQAIAKEVLSGLKDQGRSLIGHEGFEEGNWALIDCGDVVFHCFLDIMRRYYDLEGFWADAKILPLLH
jgi:ribosome-associated protein